MVMLGDLSIKEIEERTGIIIPVECAEYMEKNRQSDVSISLKAGKWHCFDIPFMLLCGDLETAKLIHSFLLPGASKIKTPINISIQKGE